MAIALNPKIPDLPKGAVAHPVIKNCCAFENGEVWVYDPRIKAPVWYQAKGILNTHGRRQSQIAGRLRLHYQIVYECFSQTVPKYGDCKDRTGLTIDHLDRNRDNNAASNLRLVSKRENVISAHSRAALPFGIENRNNRYRVKLRVGGVMTSLGTYGTVEQAIIRRDSVLRSAA